MAVTISFELSDEDLQHFVAMAQDAQAAVSTEGLSREEIVDGARGVFEVAESASTPLFIAERLKKLGTLVNMVDDEEWQLPEEHMERVLSAMCYFSNPDDLIPDRIPGVGFLDDAIMVELMVENLEAEIAAYDSFCKFRDTEGAQRESDGLTTDIGEEDWLAEKRTALHDRIIETRKARLSGTSLRVPFWM